MSDEKDVDDIIDSITGAVQIGKAYFFRNTTYHMLGRVTQIFKAGINVFVKIEEASWVAESGKFDEFMLGKVQGGEREYVNEWFVNLNHTSDFGEWKTKLPK